MIIDSHVHLMSPNFNAKPYWDSWSRLFSSLSGKPVEAIAEKLPAFYDETGEMLIGDMDKAGIGQSWISVLDLGLASTIGEARYSIEEICKRYARVAEKSGGRIVAWVGVDPRRKNAVELLETGVKEWGMKGLKLLPPCGFYPNDKNCYKLYAKADELGIPVLVHTGPEAIPMYSKYSQPIYLDEVANDFPNLTLILGHAGFCWWEEALHIASLKPNLYLDLAGWQPSTIRHPVEEFYGPLRKMLDGIGASRVLFGSDWPAYRLLRGGQANWIKAFKEPPEEVRSAGITFTAGEVDAILGGNAARIMS